MIGDERPDVVVALEHIGVTGQAQVAASGVDPGIRKRECGVRIEPQTVARRDVKGRQPAGDVDVARGRDQGRGVTVGVHHNGPVRRSKHSVESQVDLAASLRDRCIVELACQRQFNGSSRTRQEIGNVANLARCCQRRLIGRDRTGTGY